MKSNFVKFMQIYMEYRTGKPPFRPAHAYYCALKDARIKRYDTPSYSTAKRYEKEIKESTGQAGSIKIK